MEDIHQDYLIHHLTVRKSIYRPTLKSEGSLFLKSSREIMHFQNK